VGLSRGERLASGPSMRGHFHHKHQVEIGEGGQITQLGTMSEADVGKVSTDSFAGVASNAVGTGGVGWEMGWRIACGRLVGTSGSRSGGGRYRDGDGWSVVAGGEGAGFFFRFGHFLRRIGRRLGFVLGCRGALVAGIAAVFVLARCQAGADAVE
jgi:hypothetical protein